MDLNGKNWIPIFAAVPALLAFILLFLDNGITWHLINRKENKITHGAAYNYDTIVIGISILVNSMFGLPWLCAATVRSVNHLQALATKDEKGTTIVSVQETRLTHLLIHVLVLVTLFAMQILKLLPMSVLYGVFLYMGITALSGNQFYERILMIFMEPSKYPQRAYTKCISHAAMHKMTAVQLFLFALLYVVKTIKSIAIGFPLIIAACIPIRIHLLPKMFDADVLTLLDGDDDEIKACIEKKEDIEKQTTSKTSDLGSVSVKVTSEAYPIASATTEAYPVVSAD